ncbi:hypothetical protein N1851_002219 [Merluccius polli]|uniref:Uncharacterized protein n=1 Tax=Merluccius polli TaxID=89951 RepID=A0AA47NCB8_MERPO|nr:hypothetical protein N1851_002219 [Merluccius polli]
MAVYISRWNKVEGREGHNAHTVFLCNIRARVWLEFQFYKTIEDVDAFKQRWCYAAVLLQTNNSPRGGMASPGDPTKPRLTRRHGCKCVPDASVTVEDVLLAMCEVVGGGKNIKSASRMNKAIVVFLAETAMTPGPSSAGAQRPFRWQDKQFAPTPQQQPTSTAEDPEISASLEADAEEDAHRTAGLQQLKSASQPQRSSGKRKARSNASQAGAKTGRRTRSLERSGAVSGDESEIDFNEYQEVTMENVQQPGEGESVDALGKFAKKGKQNLYSITRLNKFLDDTKGQRKISLTSFFPDYNLLLLSATAALRNATMTELTIQKRFRIKKLQSTVRAELNSRVKSTVLPNEY